MHIIMLVAAIALLLLYVTLSAVDGFYIHLWKLRLHARPQSWREHLWHTGRALLFAPLVAIVFLAPTAGALLWTGVALVALDTLLEVLDVRDERASRAELGGVGRGELAVHVVLVAARAVAIALAFAARPAEAWALDAPATIGAHPGWITTVVSNLIPGAILGALLHVGLAWAGRPSARISRVL
jgi:hypothetical protein